MKIKKLEMSGFKSFVDRTVVNFDHEVLGIVGPNGCGKSNIVDAIRWVMGEQSAKHLRGRSMEDVIFNGSETRAAADMAEVTLTFENNDSSDVPVEYRDYPEIAVSRRLYRTGDSEYLINKTQVRLKDITDLFLGTGVGTKAYSIVEQGKIGLIVSAKPEDRRILIEEAAGITKFKSKKKQAERKMELTQQNLLRVGDIIAEIERNIGSLKRQAAKAERYVAYRNELEDLQLYDASHRYLEITGWVKLEREEVEQRTLENDQVRSSLTAREAELETLRLEAHTAEEALEAANNENFARENDVRTEEAAIQRALDKIDSLKKREEQATTESREIDEQTKSLTHERETVESTVTSLQFEETSQANEVEGEEARLSELSAEYDNAEKAVTEFRNDVSRAHADIASSEAKLEGFERRRNDMQARHEKLVAEHEDLQGRVLELTAKIAQLIQTAEDIRTGKVTSAEEKEQLETKLADLRRDIVQSERALDEAKNEASRCRSRLNALLEIQARLEGVGAGVKALVGTKDPAILGLVADRIEAPHELTPALAGLLGSRLQDVVVRDAERGVELLQELASQKKGRATIIPLHPRHVSGRSEPLPAEDGVVARLRDHLRYAEEDEALVTLLVGDAIVVRDIDVGRRLRAELTCPIVTSEGTVLHADGRVSGGTGEDVAAGMLESKRETRELSEAVTRFDEIVAERLAHHQGMRQSIADTQAALDRARQQAHADELALVHAEKDQRAAESELTNVTKRVETTGTEIGELASFLAEASNERDAAQRVLDEARGVLVTVTVQLQTAETTATSWRDQVAVQRQSVMEKKVRLAGTREKLTGAQGTLERLRKSTDELHDRAKRLADELTEGANEIASTGATLESHKENLQLALDAARVAQDALAEARTVFDAFRVSLGEREGELKELRGKVDAVREALTQHEMALREQELAMQHLLESVAEKFRGLRLERIVGDYHLRPPPDEGTRSRTTELSHLIERMGSVNLDAMREHEDAEKRYAFYSEQKADLDAALADLERAIQQMNRESKKLFRDTFDAVNARFQEIFPKMFRGGRAALRLTNPEDMLETGIDIMAQPPGKKLASIELMSGGEKALTAVSLIFAIFQIKPSPFCILDEVDAPLDEANVARYNEMVRSMTDRSQFILITHIKRTMQMVDVLHGVTMQESGVSRLVSVTMNDAKEKKQTPAADVAVA